MNEPFEPIVLACAIAKRLVDPGGSTSRRKQKGQAALALLLKVTVTAVNQWYWKKRPVSAQYCVRIERLTSGVVTRKMLRPDDWYLIWPDIKQGD